jgi:metal-dependent amidase/aminoacylase/carboxypeptidase family protein
LIVGESCPCIFDPTGSASSDIGNVSQILPTIHPWVKITSGDAKAALHSREFAEAAASDRGMETMINCATAMALTALDIISTDGLLQRIKNDFETHSKK